MKKHDGINIGKAQSLFGKKYYKNNCGPIPYDRSHPHFLDFFGKVADWIVQNLKPRTVMDVGCAKGFLVEALRDRGVLAYGVDVSKYAISQVREDIRPYCRVGLATEPLNREYDLVTCIEVVEHLTDQDGRACIKHLTEKAGAVLFSSSPTDFTEPTHINVRPILYWARIFRENGFHPDATLNPDVLTLQAMVFKKGPSISEEDLILFTEKLTARVLSHEKELENQRHEEQKKREEAAPTTLKEKLKMNPMVRKFLGTVPGRAIKRLLKFLLGMRDENEYELWIRKRVRDRRNSYQDGWLERISHGFKAPNEAKTMSLLTCTWNTQVRYLEALARSVRSQKGRPSFEWIVLDNGSTAPDTVQFLKRLGQNKQVRLFRVENNLGIMGGMRYCLEQAKGRFILPMDSDDTLYPDSLRIMEWYIRKNPNAHLFYSDEDKIRLIYIEQEKRWKETRSDPYLKPDWDPVLFTHSCYIAHLGAIHRETALKLGVYSDPQAEGCHDWDTFMRFTLAGQVPVHVPEILYSWRMHSDSCALNIESKAYVYDSQKHVIGKYLTSCRPSEQYTIGLSPLFDKKTPDWHIFPGHKNSKPFLTLVFCDDPETFDGGALLNSAAYPVHQVRAVPLVATPKEIADLVRDTAQAGGYVHTLYQGVKTEGSSWPWETLKYFELFPDTVMVGGRIFNEKGDLLAAGDYFGFGGAVGCPDRGYSKDKPGYFGQMWKPHSVSAVSSALSVIDASFLLELLENGRWAGGSLIFLGAWTGAHAMRQKKRIVFTPFMSGLCAKNLDDLVPSLELGTFTRTYADHIPDVRYYARLLSLDPTRSYKPTTTEERENYLRSFLGPKKQKMFFLRKKVPIKFKPFLDVEPILDKENRWRMARPSSEFILEAELPRGWVKVSYQGSVPMPEMIYLYFNYGQGFIVTNPLIIRFSDIKMRPVFLPLNSDILQIKVVPFPDATEFALAGLELYQVTRLEIGFTVIVKKLQHHFSQGTLKTFALKVLRIMLTEGYASLKQRLRGQFQSLDRLDYERYQFWLKKHTFTDQDCVQMSNEIKSFSWRPRFSFAIPVYNVEEHWLNACLDSILGQIYPDFEICLADDASTQSHVRRVLERYRDKDPRIKVVFREKNGHISASTNSALELATGDYICLMDHDDEISPDALFEFARMLNQDREIDLIYSDEDKISIRGQRYEPFFKPDWSPEYLESCMYIAHLACYRSSLVKELGGMRLGYEGAQDFDFVLRFTEKARKIKHIPKVFYHWRAIPGSTALTMEQKHYVTDAAIKALGGRVERKNGKAKVSNSPFAGCFYVRYEVKDEPLVSIVIPSAGRDAEVKGHKTDLLAECIESIVKKSSYRNFEIIVVDNGDLREKTLKHVRRLAKEFVHYREPVFNVAKKMNLGARVAKGEFLFFMNDDVKLISPDWLEGMVGIMQNCHVGVVGPKLLYGDGTLQHGGVSFIDGLPDHVFRGYPGDFPGHFFNLCGNRNYLAVTGACMMTRRDLFKKLKGFNEEFAVNYNDIDYCLRVHEAGYRIVYTPFGLFYHYESQNREKSVSQKEIDLFVKLWRWKTKVDPYYNPNLEDAPPNFKTKMI